MTADLSRRAVLAAGGGLVVSVALRPAVAADAPDLPGSLKTTSQLDAWVRVGPDGAITVFTGKAELGQGLRTAILQVAAEQLRLPMERIALITADTGRTPNEGITSGSHSMQDSATAILHACAQVRTLLEQQAARNFGVDAATLRVADGTITAPDGRSFDYGPLATQLDLHVAAAPASALGDPSSWRVIGTPVPRANIPPMVTGGQAYLQDMRLPGMLHARIVRQPRPGASIAALDTKPIETAPGVVQVVRDGNFLAVVAVGEWQAIKAARALAAAVRWEGGAPFPDGATVLERIAAAPHRDIPILDRSGASDPAAKQLKARYTKPYVMHGSIGPSCAVAQLDGGMMTVWSHTQGVYPLRGALAQLLRMPPNQVRCIHVPGSGCYGHNGADDAAGDAALVARALPGRPIRVQWMREDEHTNEPYGPAMFAEIDAALDATGRIVAWDYGVWSNTHSTRPNVGGLLLQNAALPGPLPVPPPAPIPMPEGGGERNSIPIYDLPTARVVSHFVPEMPVRVSALRSLGAYLNVFAIESFMDELAAAAGADPLEFRLRHLTDDRARAVLALAAEKFGWARPGPRQAGRGRGIAFARYKNLAAYCAVALELAVERETGRVRIGRVVAAVDSGQPINPDGIRNQIEGAIVQSASWTLYEQVRFEPDRVASADWSSYPILRFPAAPASVEVHVVSQPGKPFLGTGEAGQGPTAAAIANALFDATGQRLRDLPFTPAVIARA
ncbi:MAG: xanthine dehydrogenase family protein molybdopterin-binding subunit [Acetobacteraceae bacterium]